MDLTESRKGQLLWSESFQVADPLDLQIVIIERVTKALGIRLTDTQRLRLVTKPTSSLEAYRAYMEGRHALWLGAGTNEIDAAAEPRSAIRHLQRAVELDSGFASAWAELANAFFILAETPSQPAKEPVQLGKAAARKAVEIGPNLADSHVAIACMKETEFDWTAAEAAYRRALQLDPNHIRAHHWYGFLLQRLGRSKEARSFRERALQLDPMSLENIAHMGNQLASEGRLEEALAKYREGHRQRRQWSTPAGIAELLRRLHRDLEALDAYDEHFLVLGETREAMSELRTAFHSGGWPAYWRTRLKQVERQPAPYVQWHIKAHLHALNGNPDQAFGCMARSLEDQEPSALNLRYDAAFDPYRADPRFEELLRRMNLGL